MRPLSPRLKFFTGIGEKPSLLVIIFSLVFAYWLIDLWRPYNAAKGESNFVWDIFGYYSYLPAYFLNNGSFDWKGALPTFVDIGPAGIHMSKYTYGMSVLYAPFFAIGYLLAMNTTDNMDGFGTPFANSVKWGSIIYVIIGLIYLRSLLRFYFTEKIAALTLFAALFGTMLFMYTYIQSEMPHAYLFALFAAFLYYTKRWHDEPCWGFLLAIAFTGGLSALIRPTEVYIFFFFLLWNVKTSAEARAKWNLLVLKWPQMLTIVLVSLLLWIPQLLYWKTKAGTFFHFSYGDERFFWSDPQVLNILFSYRKGWLVYTPLAVMAFAGFFFIPKEFPLSKWLFLIISIATVYVFSCWWDWNYGGCFGARAFCQQIAFLSIPLAFFFRFVFSAGRTFRLKGWLALLSVVFLFSCVWLNIGQSYQYQKIGKIHPWAMSKEAYWQVMRKFQYREEAEYQYWGALKYPEHDLWKQGKKRDDEQN